MEHWRFFLQNQKKIRFQVGNFGNFLSKTPSRRGLFFQGISLKKKIQWEFPFKMNHIFIRDFPLKFTRDFLIIFFYTGIPFKMNLDQKKDKERKKERKPRQVLLVLCWNFTRASLARAVLLSKIRQVWGRNSLKN